MKRIAPVFGCGLIFPILAASSITCVAEVTRFSYEASVTQLDVPTGHPLEGMIGVGDTLTGSFQYDRSLPDLSGGATVLGNYTALPAQPNHFMAVGENGFKFDSNSIDRPFFEASVEDDFQGRDALLVNMSGDTSPSTLTLQDTIFVEVGLLLQSFDLATFASDALPDALPLEQFQLAGIDFWGLGRSQLNFLIHTTVTKLDVMPAEVLGDFDGSGSVDQADLDLVLLNWGASTEQLPGTWLAQRPTGNVSQGSLDAVLLHWGAGLNGNSVQVVPEPGTVVLLLLAGGFLFVCRRVF